MQSGCCPETVPVRKEDRDETQIVTRVPQAAAWILPYFTKLNPFIASVSPGLSIKAVVSNDVAFCLLPR